MYCPQCLSHTLEIASKGTVKVKINGKMRDNGVFFFNTERESEEEIADSIRIKLTEFCTWYSTFQNKDPILYLTLSTRDAHCVKQCVMPASFHTTIIDSVIPKPVVQKVVDDVAKKFDMVIEIRVLEEEEPNLI